MSDQERLDEATEALGQIIRSVDALAKTARKEASDRCKAGQNDLSADLRSIESSLRMGAGMLCEAYAKGRRLQVPQAGGGMVTPFGGGS